MTSKGWSLLVYGLMSIIVGTAVLPGFDDWPPGAPIMYFPAHLRGAIWVIAGVISIASVFRPCWQRVAVNLLVLMPIARTVSFSIVYLEWLLPGGRMGDPRGLVQAVTYVAITWGIWLTGRLDRTAAARRLAQSVKRGGSGNAVDRGTK